MVDRTVTAAKGTVIVNPGQENVEIAYTGLSFSRPEQVKFKYRLAGLSDTWVNAGTRRTAYFSYLPPGAYTFEVLANNDGGWSQTPATVKIVVLPLFWRTWWFIAFCALGAAGLTFGFFGLRLRQLRRKQAEQQEFSRRLINAHESERRRVAAELHDSLGQSLAMIKNSAVFGAHTAEDLAEAKEQLEQISTQSAQAISEVREIAYNLRPYLLDRLGLTKAINSLLHKVGDNAPFQIISAVADIDGLFANEAEISIYRIIQESLNNINKHAEASEVRVTIAKNDGTVLLSISDNGQGFDLKAHSETKNRGGFGLLGMTERVKMLGGTILVDAVLRQGTTIEIKLEVERRYEN